jgi:hypothetical protein
MRHALAIYSPATLEAAALDNDNLRDVLNNVPTATNGTFHVRSCVDNTFNTFDDFNDFAFQCIEAEAIGFTRDTHNGVIYVLDCTRVA